MVSSKYVGEGRTGVALKPLYLMGLLAVVTVIGFLLLSGAVGESGSAKGSNVGNKAPGGSNGAAIATQQVQSDSPNTTTGASTQNATSGNLNTSGASKNSDTGAAAGSSVAIGASSSVTISDASSSNSGGTDSGSSGYQEITMRISGGFVPKTFTVQAGKPVKWTIIGERVSRCTNEVIQRDFGIDVRITNGETKTVVFTPTKPGTYQFSCWMNMVRGQITVV